MSARDIYAKLIAAGLTHDGTCGLMGNMQAESGMKSNITGNANNVTMTPAPVGFPAEPSPPTSLQIALPRSRGSLFHSRGKNKTAKSAAIKVPPASSTMWEPNRRNGPHNFSR